MREISIFVGAGLSATALRSKLNADDGSQSTSILHGVATALIHAGHDARAEVHEVQVEDVDLDPRFPNQVQLELVVGWSLYHGCRDMNQTDDEYFSESVTYTADGNLIFQLPSPCRPPSDC